MHIDRNMVTHVSPEAEQDIIKRLDGVIEATIKTHEILEAKAKFGFTILSSANSHYTAKRTRARKMAQANTRAIQGKLAGTIH